MENISIAIYGRGGQGAKTCSQLIALGGMEGGKNIQAFPEYGPERRGAPVKAFVRISDKQIRTHEPVTAPDIVLLIDGHLASILPEIKTYTCPIIINTTKKITGLISKEIYSFDATKISIEEIKMNNPNIVLIGALLKYLKLKKLNYIQYNNMEKIIKDQFTKKRKENYIEPNINCLKRGFDSI